MGFQGRLTFGDELFHHCYRNLAGLKHFFFKNLNLDNVCYCFRSFKTFQEILSRRGASKMLQGVQEIVEV